MTVWDIDISDANDAIAAALIKMKSVQNSYRGLDLCYGSEYYTALNSLIVEADMFLSRYKNHVVSNDTSCTPTT